MTRLLVTGIPGTGKTTIGRYLASRYGFTHVDVEADSFSVRRELEEDADSYLGKLEYLADVVLSWGFGPYTDRPAFDKVQAAGYKVIWMDGDHVIALRNFLVREDYSPYREADYYGQMQLILSTEIGYRAGFIRVDPFDAEGFRPLEDIAAEIMRAAGISARLGR